MDGVHVVNGQLHFNMAKNVYSGAYKCQIIGKDSETKIIKGNNYQFNDLALFREVELFNIDNHVEMFLSEKFDYYGRTVFWGYCLSIIV